MHHSAPLLAPPPATVLVPSAPEITPPALVLTHPKCCSSTKLISSSPRLLFCHLHDGGNVTAASLGLDKGGRHGEARSPCAWLRLMAWEIRDKWRSLVARIRSRRRRRGQVAVAIAAALEFGYNPASYALNFEDNRSREWDGEFSVRLPASPDRSPSRKMPTEEVAVARD